MPCNTQTMDEAPGNPHLLGLPGDGTAMGSICPYGDRSSTRAGTLACGGHASGRQANQKTALPHERFEGLPRTLTLLPHLTSQPMGFFILHM
ncbi:hypothetical protein MGG_16108 [Pyricularia oryzae 70-15]|uniref:Uncharacterized protein n=2 Tax=Pyricularia oryzae TaxID=318829 RepID=G4MR00_PYRO7|nr:uncharacterized protein MGG_16108 [Pyricularia oryzae 70-15]EHA56535.1 hypothetical protein MGG_16108 [Pyricularia oryzae 70-15]KAI7916429.1 hypothetical protein M9X92_007885 [Pyricularia oryzae]KAI7918344.1 hypothetical protein M0657_007609 [Pyricularia oryzae]QBZ53743.1 hypothetical protein PoMZ_09433 [Pyricularia oryzae]